MPLLTSTPLDRVMIFIDCGNVYSGAIDTAKSNGSNMKPIQVDLYRMSTLLAGDRRLVGAYVFDGEYDLMKCEDWQTHQTVNYKRRKFHDRLRYLGFRVSISMIDPNTNKQKGTDVDMACEMVAQAFHDSFDVAIVVSGDKDFVPAIAKVRETGKRVEVASYNLCMASEMRNMCDRFTELDTLPILSLGLRTPDGAFSDESVYADIGEEVSEKSSDDDSVNGGDC